MTMTATPKTTWTVSFRTGRSVTFDSAYYSNDKEFWVKLEGLAETNDFAKSLVDVEAKYGRLSPKQEAWAHYLVYQAASESEPPVAVGTFSGLIEMLDRVFESGVKYPKVRLMGDATGTVVLARTKGGANPGSVNVTDGRPFGSNVWYGRVELDGSMVASRDLTPEVKALLSAFQADPAGVEARDGEPSDDADAGVGLSWL